MSNSWMDDAAFQDVVMRNDQQANRDASRRNAAIAFEANLGNVDALFQPKYGSGQLAPVDLGFGARLGPGAGGVNPGGVTPDEQKRSETASGVAQQNSMLGNALLSDMRLPASQRTAQIVVEDKSDPANPTFKPIFVTPKTAELFNRMEPTKGDNQRASFIYNQLNTIGAGGAKNFNLNDPSGYVAAAARGPATPIAPTTSPPVLSTSTPNLRQQEIKTNLEGIFRTASQSPKGAASNLQQYMAIMGLTPNDLKDLGYDPSVFVPLLQPLSSFVAGSPVGLISGANNQLLR